MFLAVGIVCAINTFFLEIASFNEKSSKNKIIYISGSVATLILMVICLALSK